MGGILMLSLGISTIVVLFLTAIICGIFAVVFGGALFLSLPVFQIMFPELTLGAMLGNLKVGSVVRNFTALIPLFRFIDPGIWRLAIPLCIGSVVGASSIAGVSQVIVPIILFIGMLVNEKASALRLSKRSYYVGAFLIGFYGGILGAGIMLLILTLLQIIMSDLVRARASALCLELILSLVAVAVFWQFDLIIPEIAIIWALGSMLGGFAGGHIVKRTGKLPLSWQNNLVRVAFAIALAVTIWRLV